MFKTVEGETWRWSCRLSSSLAQRLKRSSRNIVSIDTGVFSPTSILNVIIKQEGVLSQQAVEIKAKEKWLYLT